MSAIVAVVKRDCPTCALVEPVLQDLVKRGVETVPTLLLGDERIVGWNRPQWEEFTGLSGLGEGLPEHRPGCGSRTLEPGLADELAVRFSGSKLRSRRVELAELEDDAEAFYDRGWTDGLPVVAPTEARVLRMLGGTSRAPDEVVAVVPPDLVECTVEKVAVNAVLAGCRPEYLPVVLATVEAACTETFNIHGLLATTYFSGPVVIVNGPIARAIGMNSGVNALGQGNRANATIGRALQLVIRNVGGGRPGGVDRATLGNPGKYTFCFAEDEEGSPRAHRPSPCSPAKGPEVSSTRPRAHRSHWPGHSPAPCGRSLIPSCRWRSTPSWSCRPSMPAYSARAGGRRLDCERSSSLC